MSSPSRRGEWMLRLPPKAPRTFSQTKRKSHLLGAVLVRGRAADPGQRSERVLARENEDNTHRRRRIRRSELDGTAIRTRTVCSRRGAKRRSGAGKDSPAQASDHIDRLDDA